MSANRPHIETFGCRLNIWESEVMRKQAEAAGLQNAIIINTCAVTSEAEKQARQSLRKLHRDNPDAQIIVTGCAAQINPEAWQDMPEVSHVMGNHDKLQAESWQALQSGQEAGLLVTDVMTITETASHFIDSFDDHTRAFLQVQQGCDHRCTFCIIPFGRGPSRSVGMGAVVEQIERLVAAGTKEVVLTGVDITSWGHDLPGQPRLGALVKKILALVPDLPRLRLSSIDPAEPDHHLMEALATEPRLMPHLHLSMQHGDDLILKRMKRRHLARDLRRFCEEARRRRPDVTFGADIIAGFPTETEEAHQNTLSLLAECNIPLLHVFGYSPREGTPAAQMPQHDGATIKTRAKEVRDLGAKLLADEMRTRLGQTDYMLVEKANQGHLQNFMKATLSGDSLYQAGEIIPVRLQEISGDRFLVEEVKDELV